MNDQISHAKDVIMNTKDEVSDAVQAELEKLKEGFAEMQKEFSKYSASLRHRAADAADSVKRGAHDAKDWSSNRLDEVEEKIVENPATSIAIAVALGYIVAKLMHRK